MKIWNMSDSGQGKARTYMPINSQFPRATEQPLRRPVAACLLVWFVRA